MLWNRNRRFGCSGWYVLSPLSWLRQFRRRRLLRTGDESLSCYCCWLAVSGHTLPKTEVRATSSLRIILLLTLPSCSDLYKALMPRPNEKDAIVGMWKVNVKEFVLVTVVVVDVFIVLRHSVSWAQKYQFPSSTKRDHPPWCFNSCTRRGKGSSETRAFVWAPAEQCRNASTQCLFNAPIATIHSRVSNHWNPCTLSQLLKRVPIHDYVRGRTGIGRLDNKSANLCHDVHSPHLTLDYWSFVVSVGTEQCRFGGIGFHANLFLDLVLMLWLGSQGACAPELVIAED